jgi:hypothetical protein
VLDRRRLALLLLMLPLLIGGGGWLGFKFSGPASRVHATVSLAEELLRAQKSAELSGPRTAETLALNRAQQSSQEILTEAVSIQRRFVLGGWIFGGWVGLVIGAKLISLSLRRARTDYEPDRGACFACARCFSFCPNELVRRGLMPEATAAEISANAKAAVCAKS